ncbi:hypothetical protein [Halogeometricum luteum]|uniref:DUF8147 domain-containing protein n=1 Tax=Halogeometricum luteum TaxID=2950537 RepID=A0ABU2G1P3_9EURY|nr:hypothetical protein [Halogeometricum sp. S3BR5-2]MDS0294697.1 hypothetical protein [Halogeometricum sp. S3BR5-2]
MRLGDGLLGAVVAVAGFVVVTAAVTELLADAIEFSLLLGLPAGLVAGGVLGLLCYRWLGDEDAGVRRRGVGFAGFGVFFLGTLLSLVALAGFRNSRALPVAVAVGVAAAVGAVLWFRRSDRAVARGPPR